MDFPWFLEGFPDYNGMELEKAEKDRAVVRLHIGEMSKNPLGIVHGGALYTMADCAATVAAHTDGRHYVTQGSTMHYLRSPREGTIRAVGEVVHRGRGTCILRTELRDGEETLLALGEFTFFCLDRA